MNRRQFLTASATIATLGATASIPQKSIASAFSAVRTTRKVPLLIVGGGPAGVCAAISASRMGTQALIVEGGGCLGGMATQGLVGPFMTCYDTTGETQVIRGLFEEIVVRMEKKGGAIHPSKVRNASPYTAWITKGHDHCTPFDAEVMKRVLDEMCLESKVQLLFHTQFVQPIVKGERLAGAIVLTKKGLEAIEAQMVIDCTGDGDVAVRAGVPFTYGNPETKRVQPATLFFHINNVDSATLEADVQAHLHEFRKVNGVSYRALHWHVAQAEANGEWDIARKSVNIYKGVRNDEWAVNCTRIAQVDATDSDSLTQGEIEGRRQVEELMNFFHKYVPGCAQATIKSSASTLGIRESRHIQGEYTLNVNDILEGKIPEDSILMASNSVDVHGRNSSMGTEYLTVRNGRWYGVPYRCLIPQKIDNMLIAGRCLSASSDAAGAVRVMPPCMAMGQAAGIAAALCLQSGIAPRKLNVQDLLKQLRKAGAFLEHY